MNDVYSIHDDALDQQTSEESRFVPPKKPGLKLSRMQWLIVGLVLISLFGISSIVILKSGALSGKKDSSGAKSSKPLLNPSVTANPSIFPTLTYKSQSNSGTLIPANNEGSPVSIAAGSDAGSSGSLVNNQRRTNANASSESPAGSNQSGTGTNSGGGGNGSSSGGGGSSNDTSNWNSISNTSYGYTLLYPSDWVAENTVLIGSTQSTNFHTSADPNKAISVFYIREITDVQDQASSVSQLQTKYQTKIFKSQANRIFSYQCVPVSDSTIISVCSTMEQTIVFES